MNRIQFAELLSGRDVVGFTFGLVSPKALKLSQSVEADRVQTCGLPEKILAEKMPRQLAGLKSWKRGTLFSCRDYALVAFMVPRLM